MTLKGFKLKLASNLEDYQYEICICDFPEIPLFHIELPGEINSVSISYYSGLITYWLLEVENTIATPDYTDQAAYATLFSDATAAQQKIENIFRINKGPYTIQDWFFLAAFYKGLFFYLRDDERWKRFDASILTLYAAWQWYNIIKTLDASSENRLNDIAEAHQALSRLLESGEWELSGAARALARMVPGIDLSFLVYRMRLQMVLKSNPNENAPIQPAFSPHELYQKPCWFKGSIGWDSRNAPNEYAIELHPLFSDKDKGGAAALRMLATEWALKRYDFDTALRLANLQTKKRLNLKNWSITLVLILVTTIILFVTITSSTFLAIHSASPATPLILFQWVVIAALLYVFSVFFGWRFLSRFGLPRLIGGIFIGYSALIFEDSSATLSNALWSNGWSAVVFLWVAVLAAGGYYLYNDIQPYTGNYTETFHRVFIMLPIFFLMSATIGLFLLPIFTNAFADQLGYSLEHMVFRGPTGLVDLHHFLVFTPLALLVGLVTQFLFEEKTITTSVWPLERE